MAGLFGKVMKSFVNYSTLCGKRFKIFLKDHSMSFGMSFGLSFGWVFWKTASHSTKKTVVFMHRRASWKIWQKNCGRINIIDANQSIPAVSSDHKFHSFAERNSQWMMRTKKFHIRVRLGRLYLHATLP